MARDSTNAHQHGTMEELTKNSSDISPLQDKSLLKVIIKEGEGEAKPTSYDEVSVHYVGRFLDGTEFDSSRTQNKLLTLKLDDNRMIKGWDICVATMKAGEICRLVCSPEHGYGKKGQPPKIPGDALLVFEIELVSWHGEDLTPSKDGGIIRSLITKGTGTSHPNLGSSATVQLQGYFDGELLDDRSLTFTVGDGFEDDVIEGIDLAVRKMKKGEKSSLAVRSDYVYHDSGSDKFGIPAGASLEYKVYLEDFVKAKQHWELTPAEKVKRAEDNKSKGSSAVKVGNFSRALQCYCRGKNVLDDDPGYTDSELKQRRDLLLALNLNCSLCYVKAGAWNEAKDCCEEALKLDGASEKAYFRRGQAQSGQHDWEGAIESFQKVLELNPSNKSAKSLKAEAQVKWRRDTKKERQRFKGMFDVFAEKDAQKAARQQARSPYNTEPIGYWSNDMADGMMSLHQEMEAFGERMPEKSRRSDNDDYNDEATARKG